MTDTKEEDNGLSK